MVKKSTAPAGSGGKPDGGSPAAKPAPLSPQETKRRRIQKILAALGMSAAGLGTYLFQSDENKPIEPTAPTARFNPSTGEGPDNASPAAMGIPSAVPTASFTKQVASKRTSVEPEASDTDNIYTLEVPVSDFIATLVYYDNDPKFALEYAPTKWLYSDLSGGPGDGSAPTPSGPEALITDGKSSKRVRVTIKPDGKNPVMDRIFGNLDMYIASPNAKEHRRNQHALCMMAELIACCNKRIAFEMSEDQNRGLQRTRSPEMIVADTLMEALRILEVGTKPVIREANTLQELLASGVSNTPPKGLKEFQRRIISQVPDTPINEGNDSFQRLTKIRSSIKEGEEIDPMILATFEALRDIAKTVASPTMSREQEAQSR